MKRLWITGASQGIGRALALEMARDGWHVLASARSEDALAALSDEASSLAGSIDPVVLDVTDAPAVAEAIAGIEDRFGPIDLAVLNAGTHEPVDGAAFEASALRRLVELNLMGTANCLEPLISRFVARGKGRIAVVASVVGYRGLPTASAYGATKAGLINLCEALRVELAPHGVGVTVINPGFVKTPLTDRNTFPMPFLIEAEDAARRIAKGLRSERFEIAFPRRFVAILRILRVLPYALYFAITRRLVPRRG